MAQHILFFPGVSADPTFWHPLGRLLPPAWRKTYLGWPGLGAQPANPAINTYDDLITHAAQALAGKPADLVAQSMGGAIALHLALRHPHLIRRIVLTATSGGVNMGQLGATDWRAEYHNNFPQAAPWATTWRPDITAEIPRLSHPALLLWGDADPISPLAVGQRLRALLPNATLQIIPGGDHMFARDRADEIAPTIHAHLQPPEISG